MRKRIALLICLIIGIGLSAHAQGVAVSGQAIVNTPTSVNGIPGNSVLQAVPGAQITVCLFTGGGIPCSPLVTIFSDPALTVVASNPFTADANGNFQFWIAPGNYLYSQTGSGIVGQLFKISAGVGTGTFSSAINLTNPTPATNCVNQPAPPLNFNSNYWNGTASTLDTWTLGVTFAACPNGTSVFSLGNTNPNSNINLTAKAVNLFGYAATSANPLLCWNGFVSGQACIQVQSAAGSPNPLALPTAGPIALSCLEATAGSPTQMFWQANCSAGAVAGITGPVSSGLLARYDIASTDSAAALSDSSGNGNNGTGTVGTAPTIGTLGGLQCPGAGASILPSALNSALTVMLSVQVQPPVVVSTFEFPVIGNGNGAASHAIGIALTTDALNVSLNSNADWAYSFGNAATQSRSRNSFWGTGDLALAMGATDHVYVNGQEGVYFITGSSAGLQTTGAYQLCGAAAGSGAAVQTYMPSGSVIVQALFYNRVLSAGEILANHQFMTQFATSHGFAYNQSWNLSANSSLYLNGDSIFNGNGVTSFANQLTLNQTWNITNRGAPSQQLAQAQATFPSNFLPFFNNTTNNQAMILMLGTNDVCGAGATAAATATNMASFMQKARAAIPGVRLFVGTMIDRATCSAIHDSLNTLLRAQWRTYADGLVDFASDTLLGADGANTNTFFQVDGIHPSQAGQYNQMLPVAQRAINRYFGNNDFSTATVYNSAAAAAVATTAGSEASNTVTLTFAATPANCQVGNTILVAGTTPAGYSRTTGWTILTRSATQVTYWDDASGLGAITVQGTGVCPQQQDADTYSIVNFGAGNFSLESCVGYTGQNIYIRNINGAGSTLLPFSAETITGSGGTALAANSTAILQSQLVSAAAAGCNWVRLQ